VPEVRRCWDNARALQELRHQAGCALCPSFEATENPYRQERRVMSRAIDLQVSFTWNSGVKASSSIRRCRPSPTFSTSRKR
jgi:hypothetical protein